MHRRRLLLGAGALALLMSVAVWTWLLVVPRPGASITLENSERIRPGMTHQEVNAIFGALPGDYRTDAPIVETGALALHFMDAPRTESWKGDRGWALVGFDALGRVVRNDFTETRHEPRPDRPFRLLPW